MDRVAAINDLTTAVKDLALREGASLVGISTPERFDGAPAGHHPRDFVRGARSIVTFGVRILWPVANWPDYLKESELIPEEVRHQLLMEYLYTGSGYNIINDRLNQIALSVGNFLEERGYRSIFFPATYGHASELTKKVPDLLGLFSQRHAAVRAGLAEFGLNNVAVTREYGPRIRFNSVITEAPLEPTPLLSEKVCIGEGCRICVDECPAGAIAVQPDISDGDFWMNPVSRTNRAACRAERERSGCYGTCIRVCPVGK